MSPKAPHDLPDSEAHLKSSKKYFDVDSLVFWPAAIVIVFFITITLFVGEPMDKVFASIQQSISNFGGWFFIIGQYFLVFCYLYCF